MDFRNPTHGLVIAHQNHQMQFCFPMAAYSSGLVFGKIQYIWTSVKCFLLDAVNNVQVDHALSIYMLTFLGNSSFGCGSS